MQDSTACVLRLWTVSGAILGFKSNKNGDAGDDFLVICDGADHSVKCYEKSALKTGEMSAELSQHFRR
jgi:hypothetical protein